MDFTRDSAGAVNMSGPSTDWGGAGDVDSPFLRLFALNDPLRSTFKRPSHHPRLSATLVSLVATGALLYVMQLLAVPPTATTFLKYDMQHDVMLGLPLDDFGRPDATVLRQVQPAIDAFATTLISG